MSKAGTIRNIIIALIMAGLSLWMAMTELVFGWVATVFFAGIAMILFVRHFKNSYRDRDIKSNAAMTKTGDQPGEITKEPIIFNSGTFTIQIEQIEKTIAWKQVQSMIAYKVDRFAVDDICLDVFCDNGINFTITEESAGWEQFLDHSKKFLPIDKFWEIEIVTHSFENNLTIIFDRKNRTLKEILKKYYNN